MIVGYARVSTDGQSNEAFKSLGDPWAVLLLRTAG
jgi:DNA invertase Pin-like site-specific DNA recombinase